MKYMLMIYGDERVWGALGKVEMERLYAEHQKYNDALLAAGALRGGSELQPTSTARTMRFGGGEPVVTDGPFAETKEQLGGYYLIEVETLEQALDWARRMPGMDHGAVEVRPLAMGSLVQVRPKQDVTGRRDRSG